MTIDTVPVSPAEVAARVIAGLIDIAAVRAEAVADLQRLVVTVVDELDPDHERDTAPTYLRDLPDWVRLADPLDRFRKAYEDLMILEGQAEQVVTDLRSMLTPTPVRRMVVSPGRAHRLLCDLADRRLVYLEQLGRAERRLRPRLAAATSAGLRRALRLVRAEEVRGRGHRERLAVLLAWGEGPAKAS